MRRSLIWSAGLHVLVLVLAVVGLPRLWDSRIAPESPVIIEVVNIDEKTTAQEQPKAVAKEAPKKAPPEPPPPPPPAPPRAAEPPPAPPKVAERPDPAPEKVPVPKPAPAPEAKKAPEKKAEPPPPAPPKAVAEARPQRRPPQPKEDFLASVLRDVNPERRAAPPPKEEAEKKLPPPPTETAEQPRRQAPLDAAVTTSEIDAIRHAIERCWNIPAGARDAENLIVTIRVWVNPDGRVREARLDRDQARLGADGHFRAAAESAMRAVLNPSCQPLPIPPKKYDQFRELVLDFNPKTAAGS